MVTRKRKGMLIKNTNARPVVIRMASRTLRLDPGEEKLITAEEVRDAALREKLQIRAISIVRPADPAEEEALREALNAGSGDGGETPEAPEETASAPDEQGTPEG